MTSQNIGKVSRRIQPEDVTIVCSVDSRIPEPPEGHSWKNVCHDNSMTCLAFWKIKDRRNITITKRELRVDHEFEFNRLWKKSNVHSESAKEMNLKKKPVIFLD